MSGQIQSPDQPITDRDFVRPADDDDGLDFDPAKAVPAKTAPVRRKAPKAPKPESDSAERKTGGSR